MITYCTHLLGKNGTSNTNKTENSGSTIIDFAITAVTVTAPRRVTITIPRITAVRAAAAVRRRLCVWLRWGLGLRWVWVWLAAST